MVGHLWAICTAPTPLHKPSEESACYGEIAPDLGKLFWRVGFLGRVVGPVRQDGAMEDWGSTAAQRLPLNWPKPRWKTFLKILIRFSKQQNNIAFLRQGYSNPMRQGKDIAV